MRITYSTTAESLAAQLFMPDGQLNHEFIQLMAEVNAPRYSDLLAADIEHLIAHGRAEGWSDLMIASKVIHELTPEEGTAAAPSISWPAVATAEDEGVSETSHLGTHDLDGFSWFGSNPQQPLGRTNVWWHVQPGKPRPAASFLADYGRRTFPFSWNEPEGNHLDVVRCPVDWSLVQPPGAESDILGWVSVFGEADAIDLKGSGKLMQGCAQWSSNAIFNGGILGKDRSARSILDLTRHRSGMRVAWAKLKRAPNVNWVCGGLFADSTREIQRKHLKELINRDLSRTERQIIVLYYFVEMTMKEIGQALDLSESRVCEMHSLTIARLKALLAERRRSISSAR